MTAGTGDIDGTGGEPAERGGSGRPAAPGGGAPVVIGVGDERRRDDGLGPAVVARLRRCALPGVRLAESDGEIGRLLDLLDGAGPVILVDTIRTVWSRPGRVHRRSLRHPASLGRPVPSTHAADLNWAIELAELLGLLPPVVLLFAVEATDAAAGVGLSPPVSAAADRVAAEIADLVWPGDGAAHHTAWPRHG